MPPKIISEGLLRTYVAIKKSPNWLTADSIAEISGNKTDTVRKHVRFLSSQKALDVLKMRPAYYYKLSQNSSNVELVKQIEAALITASIF